MNVIVHEYCVSFLLLCGKLPWLFWLNTVGVWEVRSLTWVSLGSNQPVVSAFWLLLGKFHVLALSSFWRQTTFLGPCLSSKLSMASWVSLCIMLTINASSASWNFPLLRIFGTSLVAQWLRSYKPCYMAKKRKKKSIFFLFCPWQKNEWPNELMRTFSKLGTEKNILNLIKNIYKKPTADITLRLRN